MRNYDVANRLLFVVIILLMVLVSLAMLYTFLTFGLLGLVAGLVVIPASMYVTIRFFRLRTIVVKEGTVAVVERLGAFNRILSPGSSFLLDPFDSVYKTIETTEQRHEFTADQVYISFSAHAKLRMLIHYRILRRLQDGREVPDEQAVYRAAYETQDWKEATRRQAEATLRDVLGETQWRDEFIGITADGDTIYARPRSRLNARIRFILDRECRRWGVNVTRCSIQVLSVDAQFIQSAFAFPAARKKARLAAIEAESEAAQAIERFRAELAKIRMQAAAIREEVPTVDFVALKWIDAIERLAQDSQSKWVIPVEFLETVRQITASLQQRRPLDSLPSGEPSGQPPTQES